MGKLANSLLRSRAMAANARKAKKQSEIKNKRSIMGGFLPGFMKPMHTYWKHGQTRWFSPGSRVTRGALRLHRKRPSRTPPIVARSSKKDGSFIIEEEKWKCIIRLHYANCPNGYSNESVKEEAKKMGAAVSTIRSWLQRAKDTGALSRDTSQVGRPLNDVSDAMAAELEAMLEEEEGEMTVDDMVVKLRHDGFPDATRYAVYETLKSDDFKSKLESIVPPLSKENRIKRMDFARTMLSSSFYKAMMGETDNVVVFIDEKEFEPFERHKRVWVKANVRPRAKRATSKKKPKRVMFFAAVAHPQPNRGFDGRIMFYPWTTTRKQVNKSKYHEPGDLILETKTMDGDGFRTFVARKFLPTLRTKLSWAKKVYVVLDNAHGHAPKANVDDFNEWGKKSKPEVEFVRQPANSPDMNLLASATWFSLSAAVKEIKSLGDVEGVSTVAQIVDACMTAWNEEWDCESALHACSVKLLQQYSAIIEHQGDNDFQLPHFSSKNRKKK